MSAFGEKGRLCRAVVINNFTYYSFKEICDYTENLFHADNQKLYFHIPVNLRSTGGKPIKIPGCVTNAYHMLCSNPDASILAKIHICSCTECLEGKFLDCSFEKGHTVVTSESHLSDDESDSDVEYEDDEFVPADDENELYELRSENVQLVVKRGSIVALFSPLNALELFYLCRVIKSSVADEDLCDRFEHVVEKGQAYLSVQYYEKKPNSDISKNRHIIYKLSNKSDLMYVLLAQAMSPQVNVIFTGNDLHVPLNDISGCVAA